MGARGSASVGLGLRHVPWGAVARRMLWDLRERPEQKAIRREKARLQEGTSGGRTAGLEGRHDLAGGFGDCVTGTHRRPA